MVRNLFLTQLFYQNIDLVYIWW